MRALGALPKQLMLSVRPPHGHGQRALERYPQARSPLTNPSRRPQYRVELGFDWTSTAADTVLQITRKLLAADLLLGRLPGRPAG
jgi:hypothetical protein